MTVERAKEMLPNVPQDIFDIFLSDLINGSLAWPFNSVNDSLQGTQWEGIFDPLNLKEFSQLRWELTSIEIDPEDIYSQSWGDICLVLGILRGSCPPVLSPQQIESLKDKIRWQINYIQENNRIIAPVVITYTADGQINIFDGINRIAAMLLRNGGRSVNVQAWLGVLETV